MDVAKLMVLAEEQPMVVAVAGLAIAASVWFMTGSSPAAASVSPAVAGSAADGDKKPKRKRNKKKGSSGGATAAAAPPPPPAAEAPAATDGEAAAKKKKKKKVKGGGDQATSAAAAGTDKVSKKDDKPKKPKPAAPAKKEWVPPKVEEPEEAWGEVKSKKKPKKKNKPGYDEFPGSGAGTVSTRTTALVIPQKKIGILIGPKGETLKKFQDAYGVRINIPRQAEGAPTPREISIAIEGTAEGTANCKREINDLMTKGYCTTLNGDFSEGSVEVHPDYFHLLIGPGGANIQKLQTVLEVKLAMPPRSTANKPQWVKIVGSKPAIEKAKSEIKSMMKFYYSKVINPEWTHIEMDLPSGNYPAIIGVRGNTIKSIQADTKCSVNIPRAHSKNQNVVLVGTAANIARAKTQVERAIARFAEQTQRTYDDQDEGWDDYSDDDAQGW